MFQLNKKQIIIGIVIWIIAIVCTIAITLVLNNKNNMPKQIEKENNNTKEEQYKVSFFDTYDHNDLEIINYKISDDLEYVQISGLKDEDFQKKINEEIYEKYEKLVNKIKKYEEYNVQAVVDLNVNNLLSISIVGGYYTKDDLYVNFSLDDAVNYDLTSQKEISLKDLFIDEQEMYTILSKEISKLYAIDHGALGINKLKEDKVANIEDIVFKTIQCIKNDDYKFSVTEEEINIYANKMFFVANIYDYINSISYYKKYKYDKSIYVGTYKAPKNTYVFSGIRNEYSYYNVGFKKDNAFIDYYIYANEESNTSEEIFKNAKIDEEINNYVSSSDNKKFTYIYASGYISYEEKYKYNTFRYNINICTTDLDNKDKFLNSIALFHKYDDSFAHDYGKLSLSELDYVSCKDKSNIINVNDNGVVTLDMIFKKDFDYMNFLKERFVLENLEGYTKEQIDSIWSSKNLKIELDSGNINIYYKDFYTVVDFEDIDSSNFNI